jgi:predicted nucleic acid-binding protein
VIVVDTSAWIEFLRATGSPADRELTARIRRDQPLGVPDVVRLELLAGASEAEVASLRALLARCAALRASSPAEHDRAAALYREARASGRTVRSVLDCLVAAVALRLDLPVLARGRDYEVLAAVSPLGLI